MLTGVLLEKKSKLGGQQKTDDLLLGYPRYGKRPACGLIHIHQIKLLLPPLPQPAYFPKRLIG